MPLMIALGIIVFQLLLILIHVALYGTLAAAFPWIAGFGVKAVFVTLSITFSTSSILVYRFRNKVVAYYYKFSAYWFGLAHFLFAGGVLFLFTARILYAGNIYIAPWILGTIFFGGFFLIHLYGTLASDRALITKIRVALPNLPRHWVGKHVVFVSDLHLGAVLRRRFAGRVARKIKELAPEAVFIGGDLFDGVKCEYEKLIEPLRSVTAPHGVFFIDGNHDEIQELPRILDAINAIGIKIINNEKVDLAGIELIGVGFKSSHKKEEFASLLRTIGVPSNKPSILLKHEPDHLDVSAAAGVSLELSGHTHQGQIWPLSYFTKQIYKGFDYGLHQMKSMQVYTSSGVGTWGPPLRLGTKSEIVLIEFA